MSEANEINGIELNKTIELDDSDSDNDRPSQADTEILVDWGPNRSGISAFIRQKYRRYYHPPVPCDSHLEKYEKLGELNKDANVEYEVVSSEMTGTITFSNVCTDLQQNSGPFSECGHFRFEI